MESGGEGEAEEWGRRGGGRVARGVGAMRRRKRRARQESGRSGKSRGGEGEAEGSSATGIGTFGKVERGQGSDGGWSVESRQESGSFSSRAMNDEAREVAEGGRSRCDLPRLMKEVREVADGGQARGSSFGRWGSIGGQAQARGSGCKQRLYQRPP
jgi:hypothetical protein